MPVAYPAYVALFLAGSLASAGATTVSQYLSGTISGQSTVDTGGLFAAAGTDLKGVPFQLQFGYQTNRFTSNQCGSSASFECVAVSRGSYDGPDALANLNVPNSVLISVEINGINRAFAPFVLGDLILNNENPNTGPGNLDVYVDGVPGNYSSSAHVRVGYTSPLIFGAQLSPSNKPLAGSGGILQLCVTPPGGTSGPSCDTLNFSITKALR